MADDVKFGDMIDRCSVFGAMSWLTECNATSLYGSKNEQN